MKRSRSIYLTLRATATMAIALALTLLSGLSAHAALTCDDCHGTNGADIRPIDSAYRNLSTGGFVGNHATHNVAPVTPTNCAICHGSNVTSYTTSHRSGSVNIASKLNSYSAAGKGRAKYNKGTSFVQSPTPVMSNCSNVSCHFETATTNWGGAPLGAASLTTCSTCHSSVSLASGSHALHIADYGNDLTACTQCHNNHAGDIAPYQHAVNAGTTLYLASGLGYTGAKNNYFPSQSASRVLGSCSTASCHANPYSPTGSIPTPVWGAGGGCSSCHTGAGVFTADGSPATGSHASHMALVGSACNLCHSSATKNISGGSSHLNGKVEVLNGYMTSPVTKHAVGSSYSACLSASCHSDPYSASPLTSPTWGSGTGCVSCHTGAGVFATDGSPATGSHSKHMALNGALCNQCHSGAVKDISGGNTHTNTTVEVIGYSASPVAKHAIGSYTGTCSTVSCHSDGTGVQVASPKWGVSMPANCSGCHGGDSSSAPASAVINTNKHRAHMNNYTTFGRGNNFKCAECHAKTVSMASNTVITNSTNHINSLKDYSGAKAGGPGKYVAATGVCSNVYCHSSGQATPVFRNMTGSKAWRSTAKLGCNGCHGNEKGATWSTSFGSPNYANKYDATLATANSHEKHTVLAGMADSRGCVNCHNTTVDGGVANKMRDYSSAHLNKVRNIDFDITYAGYSASYKSATKTCSNYCHSNVQTPGGFGPATKYSKPAWGANGTMTCASCHSDMSTLTEPSGLASPDLSLGSHKRHAVDAGFSCSVCHGTGYSPTTTVVPTHANGKTEISFTGKGIKTVYSKAVNDIPGDAYGSCSTSKCHGRANRNWGLNTTTTQCEKCHGSAATAQAVDGLGNNVGIFLDTAGTDGSAYSGTHVSHLAGKHNYSAPITCNQCHVVPATVTSFGHMSSLPAKLTWGPLANHSSVVRALGVSPGTATAMVPSYNNVSRQCSNTYCHAGIKNYNDVSYTQQGADPNPTWGSLTYLGGSGCNKCHGYPPAGQHTTSTSCNACHNHVDQSGIAFTDKSKHINGIVETTADSCLTCHSTACLPGDTSCTSKELIGAHSAHTDASLFLAGKTLSSGAYDDSSWIYDIKYKKGSPKFACGFCHPMNSGTHKNGTVQLDLDPTHSYAGTVKTKNKAGATWITSYSMGTNVVCNNVYCHSNGYISEVTNSYTYSATPNWYAVNPWAAVDRCAQCHGNSPNNVISGSSAHGKHSVANHSKKVFSGYSGNLAESGAAGSGAVHGDPKTSTTFNCNTCHYATVQMAYNDKNNICVSCHTGGAAKGTMALYSSNQTHINGAVDVVFASSFVLKSKAQLRNNISSVQSVYTSWTRVKGYKTYSSYDLNRKTPLFNLGTCSTASCHNNTQMEWRTQGPLSCASCHNGLSQ